MSNLIKSNRVAKLLSVTMHTVRDMRDDGLLPDTVTVGKSQLWVESEIDSWLKHKLAAREWCSMDMVDSMPWPPVFMKPKQVASIFKISTASVFAFIKSGKLPSGIFISKKSSYRLVKSEVDDVINRLLLERDGTDKLPCSPVFLGVNDVSMKLGFPDSDYVSKLGREGKLPKEITLGTKRLWVESEIDDWIAQKMADRDAGIVGGAE
ncbi:MAG: AlpA family phage regulatory protein [Methylobacter sp.]|jgi:predicted DNA-binding transcriptional regulator AlpA|nr:AlpA family phage regulatory protein [Methylobacter sp.]